MSHFLVSSLQRPNKVDVRDRPADRFTGPPCSSRVSPVPSMARCTRIRCPKAPQVTNWSPEGSQIIASMGSLWSWRRKRTKSARPRPSGAHQSARSSQVQGRLWVEKVIQDFDFDCLTTSSFIRFHSLELRDHILRCHISHRDASTAQASRARCGQGILAKLKLLNQPQSSLICKN